MHGEASREREYNHGGRMGKIGGGGGRAWRNREAWGKCGSMEADGLPYAAVESLRVKNMTKHCLSIRVHCIHCRITGSPIARENLRK